MAETDRQKGNGGHFWVSRASSVISGIRVRSREVAEVSEVFRDNYGDQGSR